MEMEIEDFIFYKKNKKEFVKNVNEYFIKNQINDMTKYFVSFFFNFKEIYFYDIIFDIFLIEEECYLESNSQNNLNICKNFSTPNQKHSKILNQIFQNISIKFSEEIFSSASCSQKIHLFKLLEIQIFYSGKKQHFEEFFEFCINLFINAKLENNSFLIEFFSYFLQIFYNIIELLTKKIEKFEEKIENYEKLCFSLNEFLENNQIYFFELIFLSKNKELQDQNLKNFKKFLINKYNNHIFTKILNISLIFAKNFNSDFFFYRIIYFFPNKKRHNFKEKIYYFVKKISFILTESNDENLLEFFEHYQKILPKKFLIFLFYTFISIFLKFSIDLVFDFFLTEIKFIKTFSFFLRNVINFFKSEKNYIKLFLEKFQKIKLTNFLEKVQKRLIKQQKIFPYKTEFLIKNLEELSNFLKINKFQYKNF